MRMFERTAFTPEARRTVRLAQDQARALRHPAVGTEHLLLGLLEEGGNDAARLLAARGITLPDLRERLIGPAEDGLDPDALASLGIDLARVRAAAEADLGPGALDLKAAGRLKTGHLPLTKRARRVIELAVRSAQESRQAAVGPGHLLLGLLREGGGLATGLLAGAGADLAELHDAATRLAAPGPPSVP